MAEKRDPFEEIVEEAIQRAERVPCNLATFKEGLRTMLEAIKDRYMLESGE